jgi:hypothetical protein
MGKKNGYRTPARGTVQLSNKPATPNAITAHTSHTSLHAKSFICAPLSPCTQNSFSALPFTARASLSPCFMQKKFPCMQNSSAFPPCLQFLAAACKNQNQIFFAAITFFKMTSPI